MVERISQFEKVTPHTLNKVIDAVNGLTDIGVAPPLEINRAGGRINIRLSSSGFIGAVTSRNLNSSSSSSSSEPGGNTYLYTVQEVQVDVNGQWDYVATGKFVNATEWNDSFVLIGTVVWCEPFGNNDWRFDHWGDPVCIVTRQNSGQTPPVGYYDAFTSVFNPITGLLTSTGNCWLKDLNN